VSIAGFNSGEESEASNVLIDVDDAARIRRLLLELRPRFYEFGDEVVGDREYELLRLGRCASDGSPACWAERPTRKTI
jgi:hypothetical protein